MKNKNLFEASANKVGVTIFASLICLASYAQQINVAYLKDISISASVETFQPKETFRKVINLLDLPNTEAGVNVYTSVIGEPSIGKVNVATLPKAEGSVLDRKRNLSKFLGKGLADFEELAQPADDQRTEIFRSLCALESQLANGADRTLIILESDFVESGYVAEFFSYRDNPSGLMDDFEKIINAFEIDNGKLPDFSGAEIILLVNNGDVELAVWSARWWKKALLHFGAEEVLIKAVL